MSPNELLSVLADLEALAGVDGLEAERPDREPLLDLAFGGDGFGAVLGDYGHG